MKGIALKIMYDDVIFKHSMFKLTTGIDWLPQGSESFDIDSCALDAQDLIDFFHLKGEDTHGYTAEYGKIVVDSVTIGRNGIGYKYLHPKCVEIYG